MTNEPETLRQARRWDDRARQYRDALLCDRCAAQAAYGHQCGFLDVHPPCRSCSVVVASFPVPAVNGWRKLASQPDDAALTVQSGVTFLDLTRLTRALTTDWDAA